ncbi:enoyl-CoA hydratase/isomerase family protein [Lampropedia aestuarii]|uniref:enoyl-CoA hydratase/isomerase family protein n=1 Tax=Lampropedia aestuarii TaxID=2562762 RepID=UPI002468740D|nr:enoyl-CoA hydratase-related protein [Lampropedia aestuarii]MDH5856471.1 enoyl-CoA hydratase-related protein [Lampropedia aestuarii]
MTSAGSNSHEIKASGVHQLSGGAVLLAHAGPLSVLTLNRPERYNALTCEMATGLLQAVQEVQARADCRVLLLHGAGPGFCAGGDVADVAAHFPEVEGAVRSFLVQFHAFLTLLRSLDVIVLTAVHGSAAGAGLSLAMMGDLCVATADARFVPAYSKLGVSPDCGGTVGLPEAVGARRALQIFLLESEFDANQAERWGLVNEVCAPDQLMERAQAIAARIARIPVTACQQTKALLRREGRVMAEQLDAELEALVQCTRTEQYRSAVRAFLEKSA